ncbi:tRNA epoxyqueuosine(34) reductase QueG [Derxia lacustris]|uniref:tRNA epoxyqueuosine(34) reductase QueG n=1 Tax=Derxia lacustris TaxID=764842 RepID=UPI000A16F723|nr:tRNA epoxyqueuosine(34) reductase QueG [Derxia lacustris]
MSEDRSETGAGAPEAAAPAPPGTAALAALAERIRAEAAALGFAACGIASAEVPAEAIDGLARWLAAGRHGAMDYMERHAALRADPRGLLAQALRIISVRMDYLPAAAPADWRAREEAASADPQRALVSVYARGRDYHKVLRNRLQKLSERIDALAAEAGWPHFSRACTDSAPVLEVEFARAAGIGWRGKHTLLLDRDGGSMFFLGELLTSLPLPVDAPVAPHCGSCSACIDACPTAAIVAPYELDARRCISYLTIEHPGPIPVELRPALGNRIYGCDDCQRVCPWNKFARRASLPDFDARAGLDGAGLLALWRWDEAEFLRRTEGSAIRRIGHERWRRNLAVALGNALAAVTGAQPAAARAGAAADAGGIAPVAAGSTMPADADADADAAAAAAAAAAIVAALTAERATASALLREHIDWALAQGGPNA